MALTCFTCGEEIAFDKSIVSKTGKQIPLWPDKENTHGHDENGEPIRGELPQDYKPKPKQQFFKKPSVASRPPPAQSSQSSSDMKQFLQVLLEIKAMLEKNVLIDSARYENQMSVIYDQLSKTKDETFKQASQLDIISVNHSKIADDRQNFMQQKRDRPFGTKMKVIDESKEKILDERIPDNDEELQAAQSEYDDNDKGIVTED